MYSSSSSTTIFSKCPLPVTIIVILAVAAAVPLSTADDAKDKQECLQPLTGLATCLPYITGTAKAPTPDCCTGLKQLLNTNKKCLCFAIKDRNDPELGFKINVTLALGLPQVCRSPAYNISECPALLGLPPNSPEAQTFYQLAKNSSLEGNISPIAGGPTPPRTAPLGGAPLPKNGVGINGKWDVVSLHTAFVLYCVCALRLF